MSERSYLDELSLKELEIANEVVAYAGGDNGETDSSAADTEPRLNDIAKIMVEGCAFGAGYAGCAPCIRMQTGRAICDDIEAVTCSLNLILPERRGRRSVRAIQAEEYVLRGVGFNQVRFSRIEIRED